MQYAFYNNLSQVYYEQVCSQKTYCAFNCFYTRLLICDCYCRVLFTSTSIWLQWKSSWFFFCLQGENFNKPDDLHSMPLEKVVQTIPLKLRVKCLFRGGKGAFLTHSLKVFFFQPLPHHLLTQLECFLDPNLISIPQGWPLTSVNSLHWHIPLRCPHWLHWCNSIG